MSTPSVKRKRLNNTKSGPAMARTRLKRDCRDIGDDNDFVDGGDWMRVVEREEGSSMVW
jgi:hypothetical protein